MRSEVNTRKIFTEDCRLKISLEFNARKNHHFELNYLFQTATHITNIFAISLYEHYLGFEGLSLFDHIL